MKIQRFASVYDKIADRYSKQIKTTENDKKKIEQEGQDLIDQNDNHYNEQLNNWNNLINQEQDLIDQNIKTQTDLQNRRNEYNLKLINQNKEEAQKQANAEISDAYIDLQKAQNRYAGQSETMAANGLLGTGYEQNQDIALNVAYQNRVATAKSALQKANTQYDNQIQEALLNNDTVLAQLALDQLNQSYQLALKNFEFTNELYNNKINYEQSIRDSYFNKGQTLQSRIENYYENYYNAKIAKQQEKNASKTRVYSSGGGYSSGSSSKNNSGYTNSKSINIDGNKITDSSGVIQYVNACLENFQNGNYTKSSMQTKAKSALDTALKAGIISSSQYNSILNGSALFRSSGSSNNKGSSGNNNTTGGGRKG